MAGFGTMLLVTTVAGALTGVGALPVFVRARVSHRTYDAALGLAAGIMIAASVFGLILPGMEAGGLGTVMAGVFLRGVRPARRQPGDPAPPRTLQGLARGGERDRRGRRRGVALRRQRRRGDGK